MVYQVAAPATNEKPEVPEIEPEVQDLSYQVAAASELEEQEKHVAGEEEKETTEVETWQIQEVSKFVTEKEEEGVSLPEESEHLGEETEKESIEEELTEKPKEILDNKEQKEKETAKIVPEKEEKIEEMEVEKEIPEKETKKRDEKEKEIVVKVTEKDEVQKEIKEEEVGVKEAMDKIDKEVEEDLEEDNIKEDEQEKEIIKEYEEKKKDAGGLADIVIQEVAYIALSMDDRIGSSDEEFTSEDESWEPIKGKKRLKKKAKEEPTLEFADKSVKEEKLKEAIEVGLDIKTSLEKEDQEIQVQVAETLRGSDVIEKVEVEKVRAAAPLPDAMKEVPKKLVDKEETKEEKVLISDVERQQTEGQLKTATEENVEKDEMETEKIKEEKEKYQKEEEPELEKEKEQEEIKQVIDMVSSNREKIMENVQKEDQMKSDVREEGQEEKSESEEEISQREDLKEGVKDLKEAVLESGSTSEGEQISPLESEDEVLAEEMKEVVGVEPGKDELQFDAVEAGKVVVEESIDKVSLVDDSIEIQAPFEPEVQEREKPTLMPEVQEQEMEKPTREPEIQEQKPEEVEVTWKPESEKFEEKITKEDQVTEMREEVKEIAETFIEPLKEMETVEARVSSVEGAEEAQVSKQEALDYEKEPDVMVTEEQEVERLELKEVKPETVPEKAEVEEIEKPDVLTKDKEDKESKTSPKEAQIDETKSIGMKELITKQDISEASLIETVTQTVTKVMGKEEAEEEEVEEALENDYVPDEQITEDNQPAETAVAQEEVKGHGVQKEQQEVEQEDEQEVEPSSESQSNEIIDYLSPRKDDSVGKASPIEEEVSGTDLMETEVTVVSETKLTDIEEIIDTDVLKAKTVDAPEVQETLAVESKAVIGTEEVIQTEEAVEKELVVKEIETKDESEVPGVQLKMDAVSLGGRIADVLESQETIYSEEAVEKGLVAKEIETNDESEVPGVQLMMDSVSLEGGIADVLESKETVYSEEAMEKRLVDEKVEAKDECNSGVSDIQITMAETSENKATAKETVQSQEPDIVSTENVEKGLITKETVQSQEPDIVSTENVEKGLIAKETVQSQEPDIVSTENVEKGLIVDEYVEELEGSSESDALSASQSTVEELKLSKGEAMVSVEEKEEQKEMTVPTEVTGQEVAEEEMELNLELAEPKIDAPKPSDEKSELRTDEEELKLELHESQTDDLKEFARDVLQQKGADEKSDASLEKQAVAIKLEPEAAKFSQDSRIVSDYPYVRTPRVHARRS